MSSNHHQGFIPLIGLISTAFLAVAVFVGTAIVSNPETNFDIRNYAKVKEKEEKVTCPEGCDGNIKWVFDRATNSCKKRETRECGQQQRAERQDAKVVLLTESCAGTCITSGSCADVGQVPSTGACIRGDCCEAKAEPEISQVQPETGGETSQDTDNNGSTPHLASPVKPQEPLTGSACIQDCVNKGDTAYSCAGQCNVEAKRPSPTPTAVTKSTVSIGASCIQSCVNKGSTAYQCASECDVLAKRPTPTTNTVSSQTDRCAADKIKTCKKGCQPNASGGICIEELAGGVNPTDSQTVGASCIQDCVNSGGNTYSCASQCGVEALRTSPVAVTINQTEIPATETESNPNIVANGNHCVSDDECLSGYCESGVCQVGDVDPAINQLYHGMVYYSQIDNKWANQTPPNINEGGRCKKEFWQVGCGPTVAASLVSTYTDTNVNPYEMAGRYAQNNNCGLTGFQENMEQLEEYGFETEQYRGSIYKLGMYIQHEEIEAENNDDTEVDTQTDNSAWLMAEFTVDGQTFEHHSLIVSARENDRNETISVTLNDPYLGPNVECRIVGGDSLSCLTEDQRVVRVEHLGAIILDPPAIAQ